MEFNLDDNLRQEAITAALSNNWAEAISLNLTILEQNPKEIETLNRLARAYMEKGMIGKAKATYREVLSLDPYNNIATKNIEKLASLSKKDLERSAKINAVNQTPLSADLFLEEPGRTKVIELEDLAMSKIMATLRTGDPVNLTIKGKEVVATASDKRLGKLPAEYSELISQAARSGSKFSAIIKSVTIKRGGKEAIISIFIREIYHSPKLGAASLFPNNNHVTSFVREDSLPLMDSRDGMVVESDDEIIESTPPPMDHSEDDEDNDHHESHIEDEEEFQPN